jgi:predicted RNA-binding protein YlqC (UPF0109 family)
MITELVTFVTQQLVSRPDEVSVVLVEKDNVDVIDITVAPEDRGRVIGKEGHTIKALRILVESSFPQNRKIMLELSR